MKNLNKCKKCGLPEGARGMIDKGRYISDVSYYNGQGSLDATTIQIHLDQQNVCNFCRRKQIKKKGKRWNQQQLKLTMLSM